MNKIIILLLLVSLLSNCSKQDKNPQKIDSKDNKAENVQTPVVVQEKKEKSEAELLLDKSLLEAYLNNDYAKCLEILQEGSDGRIDYLKPDYPLLFDICQKYLNNDEKSTGIENLLDFYLKNRKVAFEDSIEGTYPDDRRRFNPKQTVGSYLSRFATLELLRRIAQEKINVNSPGEYLGDYSAPAIYELAAISTITVKDNPMRGWYFSDWIKKVEEKKIRIELLLDAGADVTLIDNKFGSNTIFSYFCWYPFEEDYTELLDKMTKKGANLFFRDSGGYSCIFRIINNLSDQNSEAYLEYVINRGLHVTYDDLYEFADHYFDYMRSKKITDTDLQRLKKIQKILEDDSKLTIEVYHAPGWKEGYAEGFTIK
ncbi:hypothetical protein [Treponema sp. R6D11]